MPRASAIAIMMLTDCSVDLQHVLQEEQRVELAAVPHHGLAGGEAEQREQRDLGVLPLAEGFRQRRLRAACPRPSSCWKAGDSFSCKPDPDRDAEQDDREQERHAPAPGRELASRPISVLDDRG